MSTGKDIQLQELGTRQAEPSSGPTRTASGTNLSADFELELERLRAERDAMAAELQIERAERLHVEEKLRLLEREKLEQMRQSAASREKLASELEEARLRAMRAEGRQAALEADTRLQEIESRRRGPWPAGEDDGSPADEIAESSGDEPENADPPEDEPGFDRPAAARGGAIPMSGPAAKDDRWSRARPGSGTVNELSEARAARIRERTGGGTASPAGERRQPATSSDQPLSTSRLRGPATPPSRPSSDERGPGARTPRPPEKPGSTAAGGAPAERRGADAGAKGSGAAAARGGAAAGRPSIDRAQLEVRLAAGAVIKTTERFRQFQPVAQSHIKMCDWLAQAKTLDELKILAGGQIADADILAVLVLFFERSFLDLEK